jgi:spore maturation protein CgeB
MRTLGREQMVEFYRQSVVNLNIHDLNAPGLGLSWRTFEILGSGCTMISDRHPELAACFGDEIPFNIFDEPGEIIEITSELKSNPGKTGAMREKARAAAPFHSYYYRMEKILSSR